MFAMPDEEPKSTEFNGFSVDDALGEADVQKVLHTKQKIKKTNTIKRKLLISFTLIIISFWTAMVIDYYVHPFEELIEEPIEPSVVTLTDLCVMNTLIDREGRVVNTNFDCEKGVELKEVIVAISEFKRITSQMGYNMSFPFTADQFVTIFNKESTLPEQNVVEEQT